MKFVNLEVFEVIRRLGYPGDGRDPPLLDISVLEIESASCSELK